MPILSRNTLNNLEHKKGIEYPEENIFSLPEKVLQFGTGVLLRGLPDYFIDKANRSGIFNGRIVIVKSTSSGGTDAFTIQDGLYTHVIRGVENGKQVDKMIVNSSVSRVLAANTDWSDVLACAADPGLKVIISNTTEVGISFLSGDRIDAHPPRSFPGKLLAFLWERFKSSGGSADSGFVIIPTELIPDNATKLRDIIVALARENNCSEAFVSWITSNNFFCNSLVDRIVPGKLTGNDLAEAEEKLGYKDDLLIMSEVFRLWAIECTSPEVKKILSFSQADEGVVLTDDLEKFRELKLRLLNGTHTLSCAYAFLSGFETVGDAMHDEAMGRFITRMAIDEIAPAIVSEKIAYQEACTFAASVFDRFRNPFLEHKWLSIAAQYTSKVKMRVLPVLV
ncbi:MAG: tagaturonate reductase [Chitinophagaceae bacterium]|nr:tagaturonate reductase [Chitinophagaceae bacterium]